MVAPLAGCSAPHLAARNEEAARPGTCESAWLAASAGTSGAPAGQAATMRYLAARTAADEWITVASACPARFAEGAMRSAQSSFTAATLGTRFGAPVPSRPSDIELGAGSGSGDDGSSQTSLGFDADALSGIIVAEDRAGFAIEVLAARGVADATLAASDGHKTAAQRLFSLSGLDTDPRRKVYAVDRILAHPDMIDDPANGIEADTVATIEMNCARGYLDALGGNAADAGKTEETARSGGESSGSTVSSPDAAALEPLARTAASRAWHAMELGYPAFDAALFR